jgi:quinol monooxygenase YgiN
MKTIRSVFLLCALSVLGGRAPGHKLAFEQLNASHSGPVLSVQGYVIQSADQAESLQKNWTALAEAMKQKPGFISCYLSPGIGESPLWLAHSKWESMNALRDAFSDSTVLKLESQLSNKFEHLFSLGGNGQFRKDYLPYQIKQ